MSSEDQYRRGLADAARGEPDPFYYQHYYHYRRGYDAGRRRNRRDQARRMVQLPRWLPVGLGVLALLALGGLFFLLRPAPVSAPTAIPTLAPSVTALPTLTPLPTVTLAPSPTVTPVPTLRIGGRARVVNIGADGLRGRREPKLSAPVQVTFREGTVLNVLDGPTEADGYTWWRVEGPEGSGWSAVGAPGSAPWLTAEP